jgi:hypothetical protein
VESMRARTYKENECELVLVMFDSKRRACFMVGR